MRWAEVVAPRAAAAAGAAAEASAAGPTAAQALQARQRAALPAMLRDKYGDLAAGGWGPPLRAAFGYATPADWYEPLLEAIVDTRTAWLDVGCGRHVCPGNAPTARRLAARCRLLVGIDPSDNIDDNPFLHVRLKMPIEEHPADPRYDLITLRMVAEHVADPQAVAARLAGLLAPGGRLVIYTVLRSSPSVAVAALTPMAVHHLAKRLLWETEERDTFPTVYRMNTRRTLRRLFDRAGLSEELFVRLDDCRATARFRVLQYLEFSVWRGLTWLGLGYPEACLLAVYRAP